MKQPIPHGHITKKLRRSLLIIIGFGLIMAGLLGVTIGLVNYNIVQTAARSKQIADNNLKILLQSQQKFSLPENTSYTPTTLDQATLVNVIAKNQPSVVRIATMYCADITLSSAQATVNFADTCSGKVGSGSFISSDGYIATSGHVVSTTTATALVNSFTTTDLVNRYLDYLVASRLLTYNEATIIKSGVAKNNVDAQAALLATADTIPDAQIHAGNVTSEYAIQLSNVPIAIDKSHNRLTFEYNDTVIKASFVDQDFNQVTSDQAISASGQFTSSDVALLKAVGSFPYITLGSLDGVKIGDQLTAIGFPSAIDGVNSALTQTVPSITQGKVKDISYDSATKARRILNTSVPIGQGNSGGPALNNAGEEIGLNTYSIIECPDLKCYGDGQVRDIADLKALLVKNNIALRSGGVIDNWTKALNAYTKGNYAEALTYLTKVQSEYPANYLVAPLLNIAEQQVGSVTDTSTSYQAQGLVTIILIVLAVAIVAVAIILTGLIIIFTAKYRLTIRRANRKH
ncbi:MAG: divTM [Candidatus Saccharibacteria bacterium]|nr:divTM [Candidatus Saccharibacteria bacterium]